MEPNRAELTATALAGTLSESQDPDSGPEVRSEATPPRHVGRYQLLTLLGSGGMGAVFAAHDPELDRRVAVKLLRRDVRSAESARLVREARTLARLSHPHIVPVFDVGLDGDTLYIVMELVDGRTVTRWLRDDRPDRRAVLDVFLAAGRGLAAAHAAGIIHRDFKPDNMMLGRDGRVRVLDFGLARAESAAAAATTLPDGRVPSVDTSSSGSGGGSVRSSGAAGSLNPATNPRLTRDGTLLGTPAYMAPEQWRGEPADARSDQFAFCVSLWQALYGERPFAGKTLQALMLAILNGERAETRAPERRIPAPVRVALLRGLQVEPAARHASMEALLGAIEHGVRRRRRRFAIAALAVAGCVAGAFGIARQARIGVCERAGAEIGAVWNPQVRAHIDGVLADSGVGFAATTSQRIAEHLNAWTLEWAKARAQVCREAEVDGTRPADEAERATTCLEAQRDELAVLLEGIGAGAPRAALQDLLPAVLGIPQAGDCQDARLLERRWGAPLEPQRRTALTALRREYARIDVLAAAGKYRDALRLGKLLLTDAEALGERRFVLEVKLLLGTLRGGRGTAEALQEVYVEALAIRADELAARAATRLITLLGVELGRPEEGLQWAVSAEAVVSRLGEDERLAGALVLEARGDVLRSQGAYQDAIALYTRSLEIRERTLGSAHPKVAHTLNALANLLRDYGKPEEALAALERTLEIRVRALGADHPEVAATWNNLGLLAQSRGKYNDAEVHLERALELHRTAFGDSSLNTAIVRNNLGRLLQLRGRYDEARMHLNAALATRERLLDPMDLDLAVTLQNLGLLAMARGDRIEARDYLDRVLRIRERRMEDSNPDLLSVLDSLGNLNYRIGDLARAQEMYDRALTPQRRVFGERHINVAHSLRGLAQIHAARGESDSALALAAEALAIAEESFGPDHPELPPFLNTAALVLRRRDPEAAHQHLERALELSRRTKGEHHPATALSLQRLGQLEVDRGDLAAAEAHLGAALAIREAVNPEAPELADVLVEQGRLALARGRPLDASPLLERAVQIRSRPGSPASSLAEAQQLLAEALAPSPRLRSSRR